MKNFIVFTSLHQNSCPKSVTSFFSCSASIIMIRDIFDEEYTPRKSPFRAKEVSKKGEVSSDLPCFFCLALTLKVNNRNDASTNE